MHKYNAEYYRCYFSLSRNQILLLFLFAIVAALLYLYPIFKGDLWFIDDHEIVNLKYIYDTSAGNFFERLWAMLQQTEVVLNSTRYRPVYYIVRVLKSIVFGTNASLWFVFNFSIYLVSSFAFGLAIARRFPLVFAFVAVSSLAIFRFNIDLWSRLGPGEIEAMAGFFMAMVGLAWHNSGRQRNWTWAFMCLGTAISIGCKENFLLMLCPLSMVLFFDYKNNRLSINHFIWLILVISISFPVIKMIIGLQTDVYAHPMGINRYVLIKNFLMERSILSVTITLFFYYAAYCYLWAFYYFKKKRTELSIKKIFTSRKGNYLLRSFLAIFVIYFFAVGNYVVYLGIPPYSGRYGFPYFLLPLLGLYAIIFSLLPCLLKLFDNALSRKIVTASLILTTVLMIHIGQKQTSEIKKQIAITQEFTKLRAAAQQFKNIVFFNTAPYVINIYEPYFSFERFAKAGLLPEPYLFPIFPENPASALEKSLITGLKGWAMEKPMPPITDKTLMVGGIRNGVLPIIEHNKKKRYADNIETFPFGQVNREGKVIIPENTIICLPYSYKLTKHKITVESPDFSPNNPLKFMILCNGLEVTAKDIFYDRDSISFPISEKMLNSSIHPQVITIMFKISENVYRKIQNFPIQLTSITLE